MAQYEYGFIGCGNMGGSLATAVNKTVGGSKMMVSDISESKAQLLADELHCGTGDNREVARLARFIYLGVKPQYLDELLTSIAPVLSERNDRFVLVTMAAGVPIAHISEVLGKSYPIIRIMPNTPVSCGKGMILYAANREVLTDELTDFCNGLQLAGRMDKLEENLIDAASAVSGCGPAFVYLFAEAMADAGVECGLPRAKAAEYAAQTLAGAAQLLLSSGKHPGVLKDEVCSPGGTTIAGVHVLEDNAFRGTVMSAVKAAFDKTKGIK